MTFSPALWGSRAGKVLILLVVLGAVAGTGWLAGRGAVRPAPVRETLPGPNFEPRVIDVEEGDVVSRLVLEATIQADPPTEVRPTFGGTVDKVYVKPGQHVSQGQTLAAIKVMPGDSGTPTTQSYAAPTPAPTASAPPPAPKPPAPPKPPKPVTKYIRATTTGKIAGLSLYVGRSIAPGDAVATIDQGKFRAVGDVDKKDVYRLYKRPEEIKLAIDHGPSPFDCALIDYGAGVGGKEDKPPEDKGPRLPGSDNGSTGSTVQVTCRIPAGVKVFPGVSGKMSITTDSAKGAILVPIGAVLGNSGKGRVTVVLPDGGREQREVTLGLNDGKQIQILKGLTAGEKILDRAPEDPAFSGPAGEGGPGEGGPDDFEPGIVVRRRVG